MIVKTRKKITEPLDKNTKWRAVCNDEEALNNFDEVFKDKTELFKQTLSEKEAEKEKNFDEQDLSGHDFSNQDLSGASFKGTNLSGADFSGATLKDANFTGANLCGVKLKEADIENAIMLGIKIDDIGLEELQALIEYLAKYYPHKLNFMHINLTLLDLRRIDLSKVNLRGVDFTGCDMTGVNVLGLDLSSCIISPEQIRQALGRPPQAFELQQMFNPKNNKKSGLDRFMAQMSTFFEDDGREWGVWDATRDKGVAIESLMKFGKKVFKTLSGKPEPDLEAMNYNIQKNMDDRIKEKNDDKKRIIEEKKREVLEKMLEPEQPKQELEKEIIKEKIITRELDPSYINMSRGRERG